MSYTKTTDKRLQPEITFDVEGRPHISEWSFIRGGFRKILKKHQLHVIECLSNVREPMSLIKFYCLGVKNGDLPRCRALDLYNSYLVPTKLSR